MGYLNTPLSALLGFRSLRLGRFSCSTGNHAGATTPTGRCRCFLGLGLGLGLGFCLCFGFALRLFKSLLFRLFLRQKHAATALRSTTAAGIDHINIGRIADITLNHIVVTQLLADLDGTHGLNINLTLFN